MEKIKIKDFVELCDIEQAVNFVTEVVFDKNGEYKPYRKSFAIDYATLLFFTDFSNNELYIGMFRGEDGSLNIEELYKFINHNEAVHEVLISMFSSQYKDFLKSVDETIQYKLNTGYFSNKIVETISVIGNFIENSEFKEKILEVVLEESLNKK